jgi:hypothetical protein
MFGWSKTKLEPTVQNLKKLCREYGIQNEEDAVFMEEYTLAHDRRVDVLTIDLQKFTIRGFEVKVSRSDFVGDDKWQTYLHYFNIFAFVTPPGLINPKELPPEIYLLEFTHEERQRGWEPDRVTEYRPTLKLVKRGKKLQPKFVRETYGEHFFHGILLNYIRNLRWRNKRHGKVCGDCAVPLLEGDLSA